MEGIENGGGGRLKETQHKWSLLDAKATFRSHPTAKTKASSMQLITIITKLITTYTHG